MAPKSPKVIRNIHNLNSVHSYSSWVQFPCCDFAFVLCFRSHSVVDTFDSPLNVFVWTRRGRSTAGSRFRGHSTLLVMLDSLSFGDALSSWMLSNSVASGWSCELSLSDLLSCWVSKRVTYVSKKKKCHIEMSYQLKPPTLRELVTEAAT